jgi:cytochrome c553
MRRALLALTWLLAMSLPLQTFAVSTSQQEFFDAIHSMPNSDRGAELFRNCAVCHGPLGQGTLDGGVPRIGGQHFSVLAKQLVDYRHGQRRDFRMEHFADKHHLVDAQAIADVAGYVNQLGVQATPGVGNGALIEHGASVYAQSCKSCHGAAAEGDAKRAIPQLAGQHYEYLQRQIYNAVDGRRPNFSPTHVRLLARLYRDDITSVADYLSRLTRQYDSAPNLEADVRSSGTALR